MADPDKQSEIDKLLAEVDRAVSGSPPARSRSSEPAAPSKSPVSSLRDSLATRTRVAATLGAVAAAVVFALFWVLPFLGAVSGAGGAFLATFVSVFVLWRRQSG